MATITLAANTNVSALSFVDGDTINLAGFTLTLDVNPTQTGVQVITPGTAGKVVLGAPSVFTLADWQFTAGTGVLIAVVAAGKTFGGNVTGGTSASAHGISSMLGTVTGNATGGSGNSAAGIYINYGEVSGNVTGGSGTSAYGILANEGLVSGNVTGGPGGNSHGISAHRHLVTGKVTGGEVATAFGVYVCMGMTLGEVVDGVALGIADYRSNMTIINGPGFKGVLGPNLRTVYSLFGPISPLATVNPATQVIVLSGNAAEAMRLGNRMAQRGANL